MGLEDKLNKIKEEVKINRKYLSELSWFIENMETNEKVELTCQNLEVSKIGVKLFVNFIEK